MRKFVATTIAGLALASGSIAVATLTPIGTAGAQEGTTQTAPANGQDQAQKGKGNAKHRVAKAAIKDAAGVIGISPQELATALKSGQSIAQVATSRGVDPQTVVNKLVADATTRIDQAVAKGKLDQTRADKIKSQLNDRVTKLVNKQFDGADKPKGTPQP